VVSGPPLGRIGELIEVLGQSGRGVTIRPVDQDSRMSGAGSDVQYAFEGWEVGWITGAGGEELAVGRTIEEAVNAALEALARG
jgi:hypothetical protein